MGRFWLVILEAGLVFGLAGALSARLIQFAVERVRGRGFSRSTGWRATLAWIPGFAIGAVSGAAVMSIGILTWPLAIVACAIAAWNCRALPEGAIGAGLGAGVVILVVGLMNLSHLRDLAGGTLWFPVAIGLIGAALLAQMEIGRRAGAPLASARGDM